MKVSLVFRLNRFIRFLFKGVGRKETEHYLFILPKRLSDVELYCALADHGWQPNYLGFVYSGQVYQCRRLVNRGKHQYHARFYTKGDRTRVTGHFEIAPEWDTGDHLAGVDLRTMTITEAETLQSRVGMT